MNHGFNVLSQEVLEFENFLKDYLKKRFKNLSEKGRLELKKSFEYTLFSPCKRFRPVLSFGVCQALGVDYKQAFPLAAAVEFIHTASLIHDDLPSMDNDSERRGKKSNHLVFQEDIALLAGDALLIEAFYVLSFFKQSSKLIQCVSDCSSINGMMGGQALDLKPEGRLSLDSIKNLYSLKTGTLIRASVEGVFYLTSNIDTKTKEALEKFAFYLGLAFQLADDLQDKELDEKNSILCLISEQEAINQLTKWTQISLDALKGLSSTEVLERLLELNQARIEELK